MPNADPGLLSTPARLEALESTGLLDAPPSPALERLTRMTARLIGVPIAVVSLIDRDRQYFAASTGLPPAVAEAGETPLSHSFCQHVVASASPLVVADAVAHPLVHDNLAIVDFGVAAYAGFPLRGSEGETLGSLCVCDRSVREWTSTELDVLQDLAQAAMTEIELLRATQLLRERGRELQSLLDTTDEFVARLSPRGDIQYANAALRRIIGAHPRLATPGGVFRILDPASRPLLEDAWRRVLALEASVDVALTLAPPGRPPVEVEARFEPNALSGSLKSIRFFGRDLTERRRIERMKDQMIGIVSHELRTPIGSVQGALQLLSRLLPADLPARERELIALASRNAERLLRLVNDLLDLERLESGAATVDRQNVALAEAFTAAQDATQPIADAAEVRLLWDAAGLRVSADADRVAQVVINLVGNAVKFSPRGGAVHVSALAQGEMCEVRVADEGRGIPPEDLDRVFERFAQVEHADAKQKGGTGLGLAIARAIVLGHGGRIWVESAVGRGSTFHFTLPLAAAP